MFNSYVKLTEGTWLVVASNPSENWSFSNSWDDDEIPNWMESHKIPWFQTTNQSFMYS